MRTTQDKTRNNGTHRRSTPPPTRARSDRHDGAMRGTKNDLPEDVRTKMVAVLNARLADAVDLHSQAKQAHWNVRGPSFFSLHELFDEVAASAQEYADELAERAVQLGGTALGTARVAAQRSTLSEYPTRIARGGDHVEALSSALSSFARAVREAIDSAEDEGDIATSDLFTEIARGADKWTWMVEAHATDER
jgi:starvation-inducible DNA-binding protein